MWRVETTIRGGNYQRVNSDHHAWIHKWRSQRITGFSDKPLCASITRSLPASLHRSNHFDKGDFVIHPRTSALCWRARWWTEVIFAVFTSTLAAKGLASWPPVGHAAELKLVLAPSARRVEVVLAVSQSIARSFRGERVRGGGGSKRSRSFPYLYHASSYTRPNTPISRFTLSIYANNE